MKIYLRHVRELGYCNSGLRKFCKKHNIDFLNFIKYGMDVEELKSITDDGFAMRVIDLVEKEALENG